MTTSDLSILLGDYPWLSCDLSLEGVLHDPTAPMITFGGKAGPGNGTAATALHEIAHFIEIDENRIASDHWGFHFGIPYFLLDRYDTMPTTLAATMREVRTWAIQLCLCRIVGVSEETPETLSGAAPFMTDEMLIPGKTHAEKSAWAACEIRKEMERIDPVEILAEWHRRAGRVPELMEMRGRYDDLMRRASPVRIAHLANEDHDHLSLALDHYQKDGLEMFHLLGFHGDACVFGREYFTEAQARSWFAKIADSNGMECQRHSPPRPA